MRHRLIHPQLEKPNKTYLQLTPLVLFAFSSVFFSRVLMLFKFPGIVNLLHLGIVPLVTVIVLVKSRVKNREQIRIMRRLAIAASLFLWINLLSALFNNAGLINAALNFLFFGEHFLIIIAIVCLPLTLEKFCLFRAFIVTSSFTNILFAYAQHYIFQLHTQQGLEDNIKGVFIGGGAGHVIGASVALIFSIYYFADAKKMPIWFRAFVILAAFWHMNMSDAKQVLLAMGMAGCALLIVKFKSIVEALKFSCGGAILGYGFWWCTQNMEAFSAFNTWMRPEIYGPNGEATLLKTAALRVIPRHYTDFWHPWLGLGPGHTVGRLGGWMLREYDSLLRPLGSTEHPVVAEVWGYVVRSWLGDQSSMFSPLFGWAGIWGDVGWLGLFSFLYIWWVVWQDLCFDDVSRYLALCPLMFGLIFTQMEEPGYMIHTAALIGLRWQQHHLQKQGILPPPNGVKTKPKTPQAWVRAIILYDP